MGKNKFTVGEWRFATRRTAPRPPATARSLLKVSRGPLSDEIMMEDVLGSRNGITYRYEPRSFKNYSDPITDPGVRFALQFCKTVEEAEAMWVRLTT